MITKKMITMKWLHRNGISVALGMALVSSATLWLPAIAQVSDAHTGKSVAWNESFDAARKVAARGNKVMLVDFGATWCGPCQEMLHTTYKDNAVVARSKAFVPVLVDIDKSADLAKKYGVDAIPVVLFINSKGKVLVRSTGYVPAADFIKLMDQAGKKTKS